MKFCLRTNFHLDMLLYLFYYLSMYLLFRKLENTFSNVFKSIPSLFIFSSNQNHLCNIDIQKVMENSIFDFSHKNLQNILEILQKVCQCVISVIEEYCAKWVFKTLSKNWIFYRICRKTQVVLSLVLFYIQYPCVIIIFWHEKLFRLGLNSPTLVYLINV